MTDLAYGRHPLTGEVIAARRGVVGIYHQVKPGVDPAARNKEQGISEEEALKIITDAVGPVRE